MRTYTDTEKEAHVQEALAFVASGQGSINTYCKMVDIPRSTFHKWVHQGKDKGGVPKVTANGLIKIKKTQPAMSASALDCRPISICPDPQILDKVTLYPDGLIDSQQDSFLPSLP